MTSAEGNQADQGQRGERTGDYGGRKRAAAGTGNLLRSSGKKRNRKRNALFQRSNPNRRGRRRAAEGGFSLSRPEERSERHQAGRITEEYPVLKKPSEWLEDEEKSLGKDVEGLVDEFAGLLQELPREEPRKGASSTS